MEKPVSFDNEGCTLHAMLHVPDDFRGGPGSVGVVFLHGWSGNRRGPHDILVAAARRYCEAGFPSLRFDFRGRGDSGGDMDEANLVTMISDTKAAVQHLGEGCNLGAVVLVGICSGGEVAIGAAPLCPTVKAMTLWSAPTVGADRSRARRAKQLHNLGQYAAKLFRASTWQKALSGGLNFSMIKQALSGKGGAGETPDDGEKARPEQSIPWRERFLSFGGPIQFVYGTGDPTTEEAVGYYKQLSSKGRMVADFHLVQGANHSFYSLSWKAELIDVTLSWLQERARELHTVPVAASR
ncbi:MAG: alpha/beta fold hydrolase [Armatimonadota bacterium]